MTYYELLMAGDNFQRLYTFQTLGRNRQWYYLKLVRLQTIDNNGYTSIEGDQTPNSYFPHYCLAKNNRLHYYLFRPFDGDSNLILDEDDVISDLREI